MSVSASSMSYQTCFAAQVGALGSAGQRRLRRSSVLIVGAGGLGTSICTGLALAGVGRIVLVDPQNVDVENMNRYAFMRPTDVGKPKVDVVAGFFEGRPHVTIVPVIGRAEEIETLGVAHGIGLVISASNTVPSRIAVAQVASRRRIPHVSAALSDGRQARGGFVTAWAPTCSRYACPACFLNPTARLDRGESLLATVVGIVGATAAALAVRLLAARAMRTVIEDLNCISVDVDRMSMEALRVIGRPDCQGCGPTARQKRGRS